MPRYANWLAQGLEDRGHHIEIWRPEALFFKLPLPSELKKWMGYIDQYIVFPKQIKQRLGKQPKDTLYVFTDHALGPWVPVVANYPHVVHCHDFLAQQSALGKIEETQTGWTGKKYQSFIRNGFRKGKYFISISNKTRQDLHNFLPAEPLVSEVVYNGVNKLFKPLDKTAAREFVSKKLSVNVAEGYLLHVGGNQWYKNRIGVVEIYDAWRKSSARKYPLLLVGAPPAESLKNSVENSPFKSDIYFVTDLDDQGVVTAYSGASVFIFPSLAEGFGWPIAEAMACKCPVITTNEAPMTEVAGDAAFLIDKMPLDATERNVWANKAGKVVDKIVESPAHTLDEIYSKGIENAARFDSDAAIQSIETVYKQVMSVNNIAV